MVALACGPVGVLPGGRLSGEVAADPVRDWASLDQCRTIQLETRPADPYSVNIWGAGIGHEFYLASGRGGDARWVEHIASDPNVRLRVCDRIYELRAVRIDEDAETERFLEAVKRKYDWEPDAEEREEAWLFRLDPR